MVNQEQRLDQRIKKLLAEDKRTVRWLSDQTGIPYSTIGRRLDHPDQFTLRELLAVSDALGTELMLGLGGSAAPAHEQVAA